MAKKGPEYKVKMRIKKLLDEYGAWYFMPSAAAFGRSGIPDFMVCHRGCFVAVEAKAGGNQPTPLQDRELASINKAGGWALVCNEDRIEGDQGLEGLLDIINSMADRNRDLATKNYDAVMAERGLKDEPDNQNTDDPAEGHDTGGPAEIQQPDTGAGDGRANE